MPATVIVNKMTVVHKASSGMVIFMPDVCLTPIVVPVPIPYPNIAMSQDTDLGSTTVTCDGNPIMLPTSFFKKSTGDEAGSIGGVGSGVIKGKAQFKSYSFDVMVEGKNVCRLGDLMVGNIGAAPNTPPMPEVQPPAVVVAVDQEKSDKMTIVVVDRAGNPVKDLKYKLEQPDGQIKEGSTDGSGKIEIQKSITGIGRLVFPKLVGEVKMAP